MARKSSSDDILPLFDLGQRVGASGVCLLVQEGEQLIMEAHQKRNGLLCHQFNETMLEPLLHVQGAQSYLLLGHAPAGG